MYKFSLMSISQSTVGKQKEKQPGQQVWPAPQEQTRRLPDCVCGVSPEREIESEAPSPGLVEQMQSTWCPKHESIQVSGPWRVSQRRSSCFFKFAIDWQVATFSEAAVRTEALFLAKTSGHEPHSQAEGPYSFLVETVFESDLFDVSHSRNGSWIFRPCQPAMSLGKGALSTSPAGALDKISTSFLIDSLQAMCCALGA